MSTRNLFEGERNGGIAELNENNSNGDENQNPNLLMVQQPRQRKLTEISMGSDSGAKDDSNDFDDTKDHVSFNFIETAGVLCIIQV